MTTATSNWVLDNQNYLTASLRRLRGLLDGQQPDEAADRVLADLARAMDRPPSPVTLTAAFGLSPFEHDMLLMCAGPELDSDFAATVRDRADSPGGPTFGQALAVLPGAHWSACAPSAPLRRWRLLEPDSSATYIHTPLRAAERVVHFFAGVQTLDAELAGLITVEQDQISPSELTPTYRRLAELAVRSLTTAAPGRMPLIQLLGRADAAYEIAAATATLLGLEAAVLHVDDIPAGPLDRERLARLWERESVLSGLLLVVDATSLSDDPHTTATAARFLDLLACPTLALLRRPLADLRTPDVQVTVPVPPTDERLATWRAELPDAEPVLEIERIAGQFALSGRGIRAVLGELALREPESASESAELLWDLCRQRTRPTLEHLAQRIDTGQAWDDLVLPAGQKQALREIASHARMRDRVYDSWGFATKSRRGLGISALFAGPSGTGKTMAAEGLAELLRLDLYRIDLSRVVDKFIGETERNLGRIFDAAEAAGGLILLFDEADALFGKRTEVRDSHDRYANLEISYLLQRMEAYDGLAILTTNLKSSLDTAFLRRIRFVVSFPFPDAPAREQIWRGAFPTATPTEGLSYDRLARLTVAGGNIRNIAVNAAFAAADTGGPVTMAHTLAAARIEYAKLERPLTDAETRGWI